MKITGINSIGEDAYFIRVIGDKEHYVHLDEDSTNEDIIYKIKEGLVGACVFKKDHAEAFISFTKANNIETVRVSDVVGKDASLN